MGLPRSVHRKLAARGNKIVTDRTCCSAPRLLPGFSPSKLHPAKPGSTDHYTCFFCTFLRNLVALQHQLRCRFSRGSCACVITWAERQVCRVAVRCGHVDMCSGAGCQPRRSIPSTLESMIREGLATPRLGIWSVADGHWADMPRAMCRALTSMVYRTPLGTDCHSGRTAALFCSKAAQ